MANKGKLTVAAGAANTDTAPKANRRRHGPSLNRVSLIGRLTADPQLRYTTNGVAVTNFRLANNGSEAVQVYPVVAWRGLAEIAAAYLSKGRLVCIDGHLKGRSWTAPDGTGRYVLEVIADEIQFLSPKPAGNAPAAAA
jgi:single-strand DNA-binding protein